MAPELHYVIYSAILAWVMLMTASTLRVQAWSPAGLKAAFGNRDDMPTPSPAAARAERAARNMLENLVLLVVVIFVANAAGAHDPAVVLGAQIFFFSRLAYFFIYLAGITYVRTLLWIVSVIGLSMILRAVLNV